MNTFNEVLSPILEEKHEGSEEAIMNSILGLQGPKSINRNPTSYEYFISNKLFRPLSEIIQTVQSIENIAVYIKSFPYKRQKISRVAYLKYHVENYLNEIYVLKNRLISYLQLIDKSYKKSTAGSEVSKKTLPLYTLTSEALKNYTDIRGAHVHKYRYSDDDFDRLSSLELLTMVEREDKFGIIMVNLSNQAYSEIRTKWVKKINSDITEINRLLEIYFENILLAITKDEELIFPDKIKRV
jgi:hypothetical protein